MKKKYKATYASEAEIPEEIKSFFSKKGGQWVFTGEKFEGLAELLNPGLAANRDTIKGEKEEKEQELADAKAELATAQEELAKFKKPNSVVVTKAEKEQLDAYQELGPVEDLKTSLSENETIKEENKTLKEEGLRRQIADAMKLNFTAFNDFLSSNRAADVSKVYTKTVEVEDEKNKGQKTPVDTLYVEVKQLVDGKETVSELEFSKFLTDTKVPDYLVKGIYETAAEELDKTNNSNNSNVNRTRTKLPNLTTGKTNEGAETSSNGSVKERATKFTAEHSTRKKPWQSAT